MNIEERVVEILLKRELSITTVESCTGGMLAGTLLNVAGASSCFNEGYITYSNEAKERIVGVNHDTLLRFGAVSAECAREMAVGARRVAGSDIALSTTGIAGPGGGTEEKPVGLVYIACDIKGAVCVIEEHFEGDRAWNREATVVSALNLLYKMLHSDKEITKL